MKTIFVIIASILLLSQNIDAQICDSLSVNDSLPKLNLSKTLIPDSAKHDEDRQVSFQKSSTHSANNIGGHGNHGTHQRLDGISES
jgi:hypothetical protein